LRASAAFSREHSNAAPSSLIIHLTAPE
jgi:hypothetical protein